MKYCIIVIIILCFCCIFYRPSIDSQELFVQQPNTTLGRDSVLGRLWRRAASSIRLGINIQPNGSSSLQHDESRWTVFFHWITGFVGVGRYGSRRWKIGGWRNVENEQLCAGRAWRSRIQSGHIRRQPERQKSTNCAQGLCCRRRRPSWFRWVCSCGFLKIFMPINVNHNFQQSSTPRSLCRPFWLVFCSRYAC